MDLNLGISETAAAGQNFTTLTPSLRQEFDLRFSELATSLRQQFASFNPSEEEFRAIYRAKNIIGKSGEQVSSMAMQELEAALGRERFADFQRSNDLDYQLLYRLGNRFGLSSEQIEEAYTLRANFLKDAQQMQAQTGKFMAEILETSSVLSERWETKFRETMGDRAYDNYKQKDSVLMQLGRRITK